MLEIVASSPAPDATDVALFPATVELTFGSKVDRDSIERAIKLDPPAPLYFRWDVVKRRAPDSTGPLPTVGVPLVLVDRVHVALAAPFEAWKHYTLTVDAAIARGAGDAQLARSYQLRWHTRAQGVETPPSNLVRGGSRRDVPRGEYKRALVLSGGGSRGSFQVGALQYLYGTAAFYPEIIVGTSVGAINAVKLAESDGTPTDHWRVLQELTTFWEALRHDHDITTDTPAFAALTKLLDAKDKIGHLRSTSTAEDIGLVLPGGALVAADIVEDALERLLGLVDAVRSTESLTSFAPLAARIAAGLDPAKVRSSPIELALAAVDLVTGRLRYFGKEGDLVFGALASAAIPLFYEAQRQGDALFVDGGVREVAGLDRALELGATDIVVIPTYSHAAHDYPRRRERYRTLETIASRAVLDLTFDEILRTDLNRAIDRQTVLNRYGGDVRIRVITPEVDIYPSSSFHPEGIRRAMAYGHEQAQRVFTKQTVGTVPQPIAQTRSACLLVVKPVSPSGIPLADPRVLYDYAGGLSEEIDHDAGPSLRIIVRSGNQVLYTYPSDHLWSYGDVVVPGSDDDLISPLQPYTSARRLKEFRAAATAEEQRKPIGEFIAGLTPMQQAILWRRHGLVYALPIHHPTAPLPPTLAREPMPLSIDVIQSFRKDGRKELRTTQQIEFLPDAEGVMEVTIRMPLEVPRGASAAALVRFTHDRRNVPPALTLLGAGFGDLTRLTGHDGVWSGDGEFQCSRDARYLPGMRGVEILRTGVVVQVFPGDVDGPGGKQFSGKGFHVAPFDIHGFRIGLNL